MCSTPRKYGCVMFSAHPWSGVVDVECDVEKKRVTVQSSTEISDDIILEKLSAWSKASGKEIGKYSDSESE